MGWLGWTVLAKTSTCWPPDMNFVTLAVSALRLDAALDVMAWRKRSRETPKNLRSKLLPAVRPKPPVWKRVV